MTAELELTDVIELPDENKIKLVFSIQESFELNPDLFRAIKKTKELEQLNTVEIEVKSRLFEATFINEPYLVINSKNVDGTTANLVPNIQKVIEE